MLESEFNVPSRIIQELKSSFCVHSSIDSHLLVIHEDEILMGHPEIPSFIYGKINYILNVFLLRIRILWTLPVREGNKKKYGKCQIEVKFNFSNKR